MSPVGDIINGKWGKPTYIKDPKESMYTKMWNESKRLFFDN
ncbi:hypothetical protein [Brachyspira hyodysenteriae]|nr:hypothetical protein [Brachyspira hyodysenteriae]MCZ9889658.1 hypothetical protein [Brachyspira hyodysenteriae]